jgi:uncharacterized membrane protein
MLSSTGLNPRTGAALAYSGWWLTGAVIWFLERRDRYVRFHAAQATVAFGLIAAFVMLCGALAVAALTFAPMLFQPLMLLGAAALLGGVVLWGVTMWKVAGGDEWRLPIAARMADRLCAA